MLTLTTVLVLTGACGAKKSQAYYDQSSKVVGTELDGSYTIRAWGRARNAVDAYVQARKQAVYDIIFTELTIQSGTVQTPTGTLRPLILERGAREKYEDYFNAFFADKGEFENYCSLKERRTMSSNFYRTDNQTVAQVNVCVFRSQLKKKLQEDGIIK